MQPAFDAAADESPISSDDLEWEKRSIFWHKKISAKSRRFSAWGGVRQPLILTGHGVRIRIDHGTLLVQNGFTHYPQQREEWGFFPGEWRLPTRIVLLDVDGGISFDALAWLSSQNVPLVQINWRGEVLHVTGGTGHIFSREAVRSALAAQTDGRGLRLAHRLITQKIINSIETLRHSFPRSPATDKAVRALTDDLAGMKRTPPGTILELLGIEGRAGQAYFGAWQSYPLVWKGTGRRPIPDDWRRMGRRLSRASGKSHRNRNATHPVNAMLNYAYATLESQVRMQVLAAALDPTIGYLHGSYKGKHALVLDLMEPLRPIADRAVLEFVQRTVFSRADFELTERGVCRLNPQLARNVGKIAGVASDAAITAQHCQRLLSLSD